MLEWEYRMATLVLRWIKPRTSKSPFYITTAVVHKVDIYVDAQKVATIDDENNQECEIEVSSGEHQIYGGTSFFGGILFMRSKTIDFNIEDHEILKFLFSEKPMAPARNQLGMAILAARYVMPGQIITIEKIDMEK